MPKILCAVCSSEVAQEQDSRKCSTASCNTHVHTQCQKWLLSGPKSSGRNWKCAVCAQRAPDSPVGEGLNPFTAEYARAAQLRILEDSFSSRLKMEVENAIKAITANFAEQIKLQLKEFTDKIAEQNKTINEQKKTIAKQSGKISDLENQVSELSIQMNVLDQDKIANNIEIQGIPEMPNENLNYVVSELAKALKLEDTLPGGDCYRGRKMKNKPSVIIVRLSDQNKKIRWLKAKKSENFKNFAMPAPYNAVANANVPQIPQTPLDLRIFEQITFRTRQLMYETRVAAGNNFKFVWTKNGKIFVRKDKNSKAVIRINQHSDIITKITLGGNSAEGEISDGVREEET